MLSNDIYAATCNAEACPPLAAPEHAVRNHMPAYCMHASPPMAGYWCAVGWCGIATDPAPRRVVVVEGNYVLLDVEPWHQLRSLFDDTWFVDVPLDEAMDRVFKWVAAATVLGGPNYTAACCLHVPAQGDPFPSWLPNPEYACLI